MPSLLKISFAFACLVSIDDIVFLVSIDDIVFLVSIDDIVFIVFANDLGARLEVSRSLTEYESAASACTSR